MDDFGEFLQAAPSSTSHSPQSSEPKGCNTTKQPVDLNSKIMASFDLSGSSQKASFRFHGPAKSVGRRPQNAHIKQSSSSADWKNLNLETSEFIAPIMTSQYSSQYLQQPNAPAVSQNIQGNRFTSPNFTMPTPENLYRQTNQTLPPGGQPYASSQQHFIQNVGDVRDMNVSVIPNINSQYSSAHNISNPANMQARLHAPTPLLDTVGNISPSQHSGDRSSLPNEQMGQFAQFGYGMQQNFEQRSNVPSGRQSVHHVQAPTGISSMDRRSTSFTSSNVGMHSVHERASDRNTLPSWMTDPKHIPPLYKQVLQLCATSNSFADTSRLYPIFVSSNLPKDVLGHIWSSANQSSPGQLTFSEVYIALALIALAQTGEMNLTVSYATRLKTPPIPKLQLPQITVTPQTGGQGAVDQVINSSPSLQNGSFSSTARQVISGLDNFAPTTLSEPPTSRDVTDDFADFQSFTVSETLPSKNQGLVSDAQQNEFEDFQAFTSSNSNSLTVIKNVSMSGYPDRNLINSPKSEEKCAENVPPKPLLGNINFGKFNTDLSKTLHSATKTLKISAQPSVFLSDNTLVSKTLPSMVSDDFADFKSAQPQITSSQTQSAPTPQYSSFQNADGPTSLNLVGSENKYSALRHVIPSSAESQELGSDNVIMKPVSNSGDKYSALRDALSSANVNQNPNDEFADFQSVALPVESSSASFDTESNLKLNSGSSSNASFFGKKSEFVKDDSDSVSSLELPSLSKRILNFSIGNSLPSRGSGDLFSSLCDDKHCATQNEVLKQSNFGETNDGGFSKNFGNAIPPVTNVTMGMPSSANDDGLYDLDEPISPLSRRRLSPKKQNEPITPPKTKRFVVPKKISESDDDFGDFSTGPPPLDDIDQHVADYEVQEGDSSLVDFDAFGHFEEAKLEESKKKEAAFKRTKEDATAFSDFVKSSVVDLKPMHNTDTPVSEQRAVKQAEEDLSGFNYTQGSTLERGAHEGTDETQTIEQTSDTKSIGGIANNTTWKLEPTVPEVDIGAQNQENKSKWDEEGEALKARMEGLDMANPMECFVDHWSRCLSTCKDIIVTTGDVFAALNSPAICHEVVNSSRGKEFISCTSEVYGVARRIRKGMETVGLRDDGLQVSLKEIEIAWNNLLGFCPYTPSVHKTPDHKLPSGHGSTQASICSLCLLRTDSNEISGLEYCGRFYHAPCANLWLNQIAPILPRLQLPVAS